MCFGGGGGTMSAPKREFQNRPVTVTGKQTGVDDPKDTAKATETLKIKRQKEEGTFVDPNLATVEEKLRRGNKRVIRRVDGKLTSMSRNKYRSTLRSKAKKSTKSSSDGGRKGGRV